MCENPHRRTFADRSDLAWPLPPLSATDWQSGPVLLRQSPVVTVRRAGIALERGVYFFFVFFLFFLELQIKKDRRSSAFQQLPLPSDFFSSSSQQTYTACLLRHLLFRNRLLGCLGSTLEQYLEQLAGLYKVKKKLFKKKNEIKANGLKCTKKIKKKM